jgi:hypothetical protein
MTKANGKDKSPRKKSLFTPSEETVLGAALAQTPQLVQLPVEVLNVDLSYQTRSRERIVNQITLDCRDSLLEVLKISQRPVPFIALSLSQRAAQRSCQKLATDEPLDLVGPVETTGGKYR